MIAVAALTAVLCQASVAQTPAAPAEPEPKVLMVFVDGFLPTAIAKADTPNVDRLMRRAAFSLTARAESTTISGSGYSTFLCGVHWDKHGVPDNAFAAPRYDAYPHVAALLKEARPDARTASANMWKPIQDHLVAPADVDFSIYHEYDDYSDDYFDADSADSLCARDLARVLAEEDVDLAVMMFGELDGVGHSEDNSHYHDEDPLFLRMLAKIDGEIGLLLDAIERRPNVRQEDWLVLVSADHGGSAGAGHGQNIPSHRAIPLVISGRGVKRGEIWPPPQPVDLVPTALAHLGVEPKPEWGLDGVVLGASRTRRPRAAFGANLIFNGGAEHERGFSGVSGVPDASLAGWSDPGWLTAVAYGAPGGFPTEGDPLPEGRGRNFFCGGATTAASFVEQEIDLVPLAGELAGATYELSAWLGGFAEQADACRLSASFRGADGEPLEVAELGPVTPRDRGGRTSFLFRRAGGEVPEGARSVLVRLTASPGEGVNDGYADELSLVLRRP